MTRISYVKHIFEIYQTYTKVVSYVWYMSAMSHTLVYLRDIPCISNFYRFQMTVLQYLRVWQPGAPVTISPPSGSEVRSGPGGPGGLGQEA